MSAAALLAKNKKPTRAQIVAHMSGNICRCGTYNKIVAAIQRASREALTSTPSPLAGEGRGEGGALTPAAKEA